jgi:hypothetical protein
MITHIIMKYVKNVMVMVGLLETKYVVKISVIIPNDKYETIDFSKSYHEKLNGRTIEDIYKISKITVDKN